MPKRDCASEDRAAAGKGFRTLALSNPNLRENDAVESSSTTQRQGTTNPSLAGLPDFSSGASFPAAAWAQLIQSSVATVKTVR